MMHPVLFSLRTQSSLRTIAVAQWPGGDLDNRFSIFPATSVQEVIFINAICVKAVLRLRLLYPPFCQSTLVETLPTQKLFSLGRGTLPILL